MEGTRTEENAPKESFLYILNQEM